MVDLDRWKQLFEAKEPDLLLFVDFLEDALVHRGLQLVVLHFRGVIGPTGSPAATTARLEMDYWDDADGIQQDVPKMWAAHGDALEWIDILGRDDFDDIWTLQPALFEHFKRDYLYESRLRDMARIAAALQRAQLPLVPYVARQSKM